MSISIVVDLRSKLAIVRDQGYRLTCTAFAISDAHSCARGTNEYFSVEYAHSYAAKRAGVNLQSGLALRVVTETLGSDGQPFEDECPYVTLLPNGNSALVIPPIVAPRYIQGFQLHDSPSINVIKERLDSGTAVVVVLRINEQFHRPPMDGIVRFEPIQIRDTNFHCVLAVGYGYLHGEIAILVRNSWGTEWGLSGHVWLTKSYLAPRLRRIAIADCARQTRADE
jgi:hypothetical protein